MILVLDASMALAWLLRRKDPGEAALAGQAPDLVRVKGAVVPVLWYSKVANALLLAERQRVITAQDSASYRSCLSYWEIVQDQFSAAPGQAEADQLGRLYSLTAYEATYLGCP